VEKRAAGNGPLLAAVPGFTSLPAGNEGKEKIKKGPPLFFVP